MLTLEKSHRKKIEKFPSSFCLPWLLGQGGQGSQGRIVSFRCHNVQGTRTSTTIFALLVFLTCNNVVNFTNVNDPFRFIYFEKSFLMKMLRLHDAIMPTLLSILPWSISYLWIGAKASRAGIRASCNRSIFSGKLCQCKYGLCLCLIPIFLLNQIKVLFLFLSHSFKVRKCFKSVESSHSRFFSLSNNYFNKIVLALGENILLIAISLSRRGS